MIDLTKPLKTTDGDTVEVVRYQNVYVCEKDVYYGSGNFYLTREDAIKNIGYFAEYVDTVEIKFNVQQ